MSLTGMPSEINTLLSFEDATKQLSLLLLAVSCQNPLFLCSDPKGKVVFSAELDMQYLSHIIGKKP